MNVVEEMAIAAGTPVPPVYLLENEEGINAFAAGHSPNDAVVGVTRGCVQTLSRDELQGVIAHEFSHILNGDMRLNLRLMGVLFGILLIGLTGYILLRSTSSYRVRVNDRDDDRGGRNVLPLIGLALYVIGYVGVFFANLIKAAVSRQREFLADASAVQFTRNPDGIAGALKKIGALSAGSAVREPRAAEASHMFFGNAGSAGQLFGLLETHPPLVERIRRLDPAFDGDFSKVRLEPPGDRPSPSPAPDRRPRAAVIFFQPGGSRGPRGDDRCPAVTLCGGAAGGPWAYPGRASPGPARPQATVSPCCSTRQRPYTSSRFRGSTSMLIQPCAQMRAVLPEVRKLAPEARLPLVEMAVPALRQMSPAQMREFLAGVKAAVEADNKLTIFEYALQRLLLRHLVAYFVSRPSQPPRYTTAEAAGRAGERSALGGCARGGQSSPAAAAAAFAAGVQAVNWPPRRSSSRRRAATDLLRLDAALRERSTWRAGRSRNRSCLLLRGDHRRGRPDDGRGG